MTSRLPAFPSSAGMPKGGTVGVFDSGFGGLTVLRALLPRLPGAHFVYLGDTARLPYGAKSQATVARFAIEAARFLVAQGAGMLVIACNTATALALPEIRAAVAVPVVGVVEPGAEAALAAAGSSQPHSAVGQEPDPHQPRNVLVLATAATVQSHAYRDTCATLGLNAMEMPCPLLVPLVEEGWTDHPVTREVLRIYLSEALKQTAPEAIVLGCTHYPLIASAITATFRELGCNAPVVDSAEATAQVAQSLWHPEQTFSESSRSQHAGEAPITTPPSTFTCYATDSVEKFARLGTQFLGQPIPEVHLLDLGG